ncbi:alpha-glucosidase [Pontibacillus sp. HMF3514]|uniref:glycoside hydrolase family 13 protein n=1 Tax=Pontibacillus sp. HMF3514 TaxID=2692425 RepID=UPI00131FE726|nr:alpha-glucosidase [Pontibacillus sp. HMF3514]QHE54068.1 alpha,alpha-phosphotrehalase [Pontibacillus sp. HMF3514]
MEQKWWKEVVVYQVYWRSFNDTSGNGVGDLEGVIEKLDYIQSLGIDVLWLNPFFESPDKDNGYDISDYYSVMDKAGDMETFERLLEEVHKRDMKLIMDLVVNHTSDQHPWFIESRSSKDNPKRDWYIWRDAKEDGSEPNNWRSYFTPSTWEYDDKTGQYYFHSFATEQPDLNWENPEVREEIYNMMRFWLDKGIDGFRMDVINLLAKLEGFPDAENPENLDSLGNNPGIHEYLKEMNEKVLKHYDVFTVGEIPFVTPEDGLLYVGEDREELNTLFHFEVCDDMVRMDVPRFKEIQKRWYEGIFGRGTNSQFLNNHDHTRMVTRFGNDGEYRVESAKLLGTLVHTLPGIPYVFMGEEIGMTGVDFDSIDDYQDIAMINKYNEEVGKGRDEAEVLEELKLLSRDNSRTPMQWDSSQNAGFTDGEPWIKMNPNYTEINVENALNDKNSVFYYYQKLISLRKTYKVFSYGDYQPILEDHAKIYAFFREFEGEKILVVANMSDEENLFEYSVETSDVELLLHNYEVEQEVSNVSLRPHEVRVYLWS